MSLAKAGKIAFSLLDDVVGKSTPELPDLPVQGPKTYSTTAKELLNPTEYKSLTQINTRLSNAAKLDGNEFHRGAEWSIPKTGRRVASKEETLETIWEGSIPKNLQDEDELLNKLIGGGLLAHGPRTRFEAIALGTKHFTDKNGIDRMIRQYRTESKPLGRTELKDKRPEQRGGDRKKLEKFLTIGEISQFYHNPITKKGVRWEGHHWTPLEFMREVTEGMGKKRADAFFLDIQQTLGIFSGNHLANWRALPPPVHRLIHKELDRRMKEVFSMPLNKFKLNFTKNTSLAERRKVMEQFKVILDEVEVYAFKEMLSYLHPTYHRFPEPNYGN
tara:strand:- start:1052 stop:2044 length:993 start_codon:yes stop_codon:yes gene_type:complete